MIKCTCIYKYRDEKGNIKGYKLKDKHGAIQDISSTDLKNAIRAAQIEVDNLTLTSDNRLMSKSSLSVDEDKISNNRNKSKIGRRYQNVFKHLGIEVVTAKYLAYPKDGDDINSLFKRTFDLSRDSIADIRQLVVDPTPIIGHFSDESFKRNNDESEYGGYYKNVHNELNENILMGGDIESKVILLVLRKDGGYRTVLLSEVESITSLGNIAQGIGNMIVKRDTDDIKYNLSVITLDANKNPVVTSLGKNINNMEKAKLAERILVSTIDLWLGRDATKNILDKIDKQTLGAKLKRIGVGTLGIPFAAVAIVGVAGCAIISSCAEEIGSMTLDEKIVFSKTGFVGVEAYRHVKEGMQ